MESSAPARSTRRSLLRAAAWGTPAVATVGAASAFAASGRGAELTLDLIGVTPSSVRVGGRYDFVHQVANVGNAPTSGSIHLRIPRPEGTAWVSSTPSDPWWTTTGSAETTEVNGSYGTLQPGTAITLTVRWSVLPGYAAPDIHITASLPFAPHYHPDLHQLSRRIPLV